MSIEDFKRSFPFRTVCEVTRELNDIIQSNREALLTQLGQGTVDSICAKLVEMMRMQKKMDAKLRQYKADYDAGLYKPNPKHEQIERERRRLNL